MEVASPLAFGPSAAGNKRSLACSSPLENHHLEVGAGDERVTKRRRRFQTETSIDSLSEDFSSQSIFYKSLPPNKSMFQGSIGSSQSLKRLRTEAPSPAKEELNRVIQEQATLIASLKSEKSNLDKSLTTLKTDHERVVKENQILRKAVTIQQERHVNAANEVKNVKAQADERVKGLEQMILQLRYHLQAQQAPMGNDFMQMRPPDVF